MSKEELAPSRTAEQFVVRFPDGMRDRIAEAAKAAGRSMNAEIVARLDSSFGYRADNEWIARRFQRAFFSVQKGSHDVHMLEITDAAVRPNDAKLIYEEVEAAARLCGSNGTVWLDVHGDVIPKSVHTAVKNLVGFGVGLVVTLNGKSTLSSPGSFPNEFIDDLRAAARGGLVWCPFAQELMHQPHGFRGSAKYAAKTDAGEASSDSIESKQAR